MTVIESALERYMMIKSELLAARDKHQLFIEPGGNLDNRIYIPLVLEGKDLPVISEHEAQLEAGVRLGEMIINKIVPKVMADQTLRDAMIKPCLSDKAYEYVVDYAQRHGVTNVVAPIFRLDMLVTEDGMKVLELNPDKPEGAGVTYSGREVSKVFDNDTENSSTMVDRFFFAQEQQVAAAIEELILENKIENPSQAKIVIPFWKNGAVERIDSGFMAENLRSKGYDAVAIPMEDLQAGNPDGYNIIISDFEFGTPGWDEAYNNNVPILHDETWLSMKHFTPPTMEVAGYKHFFALISKIMKDPSVAEKYGFTDDEINYLRESNIILDTYSPIHNTTEEIVAAYNNDPEAWVFKTDFSSHGDGFSDGSKIDMTPEILTQRIEEQRHGQREGFVMQRKAIAKKSGNLIIMESDGNINEVNGLLMDICPMGRDRYGRMTAITRVCSSHPMTLLVSAEERRRGRISAFINPKFTR